MIPMEMTVPSQGMNSNILAGLTGDILKKVTKNITETVSNHATNALQQGVPYGHILEQLLKMSPVDAGMAIGKDMVAGGGGGGKPPSGGMNGSNFRPPQPPQVGVKNDQDQSPVATTTSDTNAVAPQPPPPSQSSPVDSNSILSQLLAAIQGGNGQQFKMPSSFGGLIQPSAQDQVLLTQAAQNQQAMAGRTPMQIGDLQKIIAGVGGEQLSANTVPLNAGQRATKEYQDKEIATKGAEYQLNNAKEQMSALNQEQERATSEFSAMMNQRSWLGKATGGGTAASTVAAYKAKLDDIATRMDEARKNLVGIADQHPALKQSQTVNSKELIGKTIGKYKVLSVK